MNVVDSTTTTTSLSTANSLFSNRLLLVKVQAFFIVFFVALCGGLLPLRVRSLQKKREKYLALGNAFSGGLFLCAGFTHMLGEALDGYVANGMSLVQPLVCCMLGLFTTLFVEKVLLAYYIADDDNHHQHHHHAHGEPAHDHSAVLLGEPSANRQLRVYVLTILLSVHSLIEGLALGVEESIDDAFRVLTAIGAHKAFAAFALGLSLVRGSMSRARLVRVVLLFAAMSPLGVLLGTLLEVNGGDDNSLMSAAVQAFAAGSFIYVALVEIILEEFARSADRGLKFAAVLLGVVTMLLL